MLHITPQRPYLALSKSIFLTICIFFSSFSFSQELKWDNSIIKGQFQNRFRYVAHISDNAREPFNLRLIVNAGSVDDEIRGMAHIIEHMVFRANRAHPHSVHHFLDQIGWKTGVQINAFTRQTDTQFMLRTRPDDALNLNESVKLLSDLAFGASLKDADWQKEKWVILEELRIGDRVAARVNNQKKQVIRNGSRYVDRPTIGIREQIETTRIEDIRKFYKTFYVPGNMTLIASGNFDSEELQKAIEAYFSTEPSTPVPNRSYTEFPLSEKLHIGKVQDREGVSASVAYGFRTAIKPRSELDGQFLRFQNYLLSRVVKQQVRAAVTQYNPETVKSLHITFKEPTNERLIVAIATRTNQYDTGLEVVLREVERLRRNGIDPVALNSVIKKMRTSVERNKLAVRQRDYQKWEDKITAAIMQGTVVEDYAIRAERTLKWLDDITTDQLNDLLNKWLSSKDQFLYYQVPGDKKQSLPSEEQVSEIITRFRQEPLEMIAAPVSQNKTSSGKAENKQVSVNWPEIALPSADVISKHKFPSQDVTEWRLRNGNRLVWLARDTEDKKLHLIMRSTSGYHNNQLPSWLSQTAQQIWQQSDLTFSAANELKLWRKQNNVQWNWAQRANALDASAIVSAEKLNGLMSNYYYSKTQWMLENSQINDIRASLRNELAQQKTSTFSELKNTLFSSKGAMAPSLSDIENLSLAKLTNAIDTLNSQPVTLYLVGETNEQRLTESVLPYLSALKTDKGMLADYEMIPEGNIYSQAHVLKEEKAIVEIRSRSSMTWRPETSFLISSLNPIIQKALKNKLRHEMGGLYKLEFELHLDKDNQIRSRTQFTTSPERVESLIQAHDQVLSKLNSVLINENYPRIQKDIRFAEGIRLQQTSTWLRRLALSYESYGNPEYLTSMKALDRQVTQDRLSELASKIFPLSNRATFVGLPAEQ